MRALIHVTDLRTLPCGATRRLRSAIMSAAGKAQTEYTFSLPVLLKSNWKASVVYGLGTLLVAALHVSYALAQQPPACPPGTVPCPCPCVSPSGKPVTYRLLEHSTNIGGLILMLFIVRHMGIRYQSVLEKRLEEQADQRETNKVLSDVDKNGGTSRGTGSVNQGNKSVPWSEQPWFIHLWAFSGFVLLCGGLLGNIALPITMHVLPHYSPTSNEWDRALGVMYYLLFGLPFIWKH